MDRASQERQNRIAQWVFDTRPILGRFHLWLEDVEEHGEIGERGEELSFAGGALTRAFVTAAAVTALGTRLFGRYGEGAGLEKAAVNRVKKDADAVSAYVLSEGLWYLTRNLPENHALMVSLGEGLMPKAGETPEMGSNPLLGFGRVYARPQVAKRLDRMVHRLLNDHGNYRWDDFWNDLQSAGLTVWGAAIDTLENTSRFARGDDTGPTTVLHVYDQPLAVAAPYEGYVGNLILPREVVERAAEDSVLISFHTPRRKVLEELRKVYPEVPPERVHVWTLGGRSREPRLSSLWQEWRELGAHLVEEGFELPGGGPVFTESGTYAPVFRVGPFEDGEGRRHLFLCDGYAASAEAIQGADLDPVLDLHSSLCVFSSKFALPWERERRVMELEPESEGFAGDLAEVAGGELEPEVVASYRESIRAVREAEIPHGSRTLTVDDFFPRKKWQLLALTGYILPDPYVGSPGVEEVGEGCYRVTVRAGTRRRLWEVKLTFRLQESFEQSRLVFSPLLDRFYAGEDFRTRAVKVSDSGRLRNELQTLCFEGLEHLPGDRMRVHFDRIDDAVLPPDKKELVREVLRWYKEHHPIWFRWLELPE